MKPSRSGVDVMTMSKWLCRLVAIALTMVGSGRILAEQGSSITVKVLYDNYTAEKGLTADWGFSCLITGTEKSILFDTGAKGDIFLKNMAKMGISPDAAEVAVISHNHGDHTGGLISVLEKNRKMTVYLPPSCPKTLIQQAESLGAKGVTVTKPVEICNGVFVIGPTGDKIVEQALAVDTAKGLVIITGCSHPGVIEIAKRAKEQLRRDVYMICGGMHLLQMPEGQIGEVVWQLKSLGVQKVGATHCTGEKAVSLFKEAFGDGFVELGVGRVVQFGNGRVHSSLSADAVNVPFDTYSGYFVSNKFEPDAAESLLVISDQEQFNRVFGVAMVMGDKSHRLSKDAFKSNIVLAAIKRGKAFWEFKVEAVTEAAGVVELRYATAEKKSDSATFACPLIVSIPRREYRTVQFVENGKMTKKMQIDGEALKKNSVEIRRIDKSRVDIKVTNDRPFPVNTTMVLSIGGQTTNVSRYAKNKLNILVFTMSAEDFAKTQDGDAITVSCGPDSRWDFGKLDKSKLEE